MSKKKPARSYHGAANNSGTAEGMMSSAMRDMKSATKKAANFKKGGKK
jgi:hypothetical protein